jgi:hypothetical protein
MLTADVAPPSSLLLVMDRSVGRIPENMDEGIVASTSTCVAIGTLSSLDGSTHVTLDNGSEPSGFGSPVFDGVLGTPDKKLAVCSVLDEVILEIEVAAEQARVRIWASDRVEPSEIYILVSHVGLA